MNNQIYQRVIHYLFYFVALVYCPISVIAPMGTWIPIIIFTPIILLRLKEFLTNLKENYFFKIILLFLVWMLFSTLFFNTQEVRLEKLIHFTLLILTGFFLINAINKIQNLRAVIFLFSISLIISALIIILDFKFKIGLKLWLSYNLDFNNLYTLNSWVGLQEYRQSNFSSINNYLSNTYDRSISALAVLSLPLATLCYKYHYKFLSFVIILMSFTTSIFFYNLTAFFSYILIFIIFFIFLLAKNNLKNLILAILGIYFFLVPLIIGALDYKKFAYYENNITKNIDSFEKICFKEMELLDGGFASRPSDIGETYSYGFDSLYKINKCAIPDDLLLNDLNQVQRNFYKLAYIAKYKKLLFELKIIHRLVIWSYTKEKILERPFFGHGAFSSRFVGEDYQITNMDNIKMPAISLHPHNNIMQIWLELGLIGIIISYFFIFSLIKKLGSNNENRIIFSVMPLISIIQVFFIGQLSYGFWQSWWIAIIIMNFILYSMLFRENTSLKNLSKVN